MEDAAKFLATMIIAGICVVIIIVILKFVGFHFP
jgi:hypothetical protein